MCINVLFYSLSFIFMPFNKRIYNSNVFNAFCYLNKIVPLNGWNIKKYVRLYLETGEDMEKLIITNNQLVYEKYNGKIEMEYVSEYTYLEILMYVRDKVHQGHKLLTHPLSGSVKPNETPFKSIVISKKPQNLEFYELSIIDESLNSTKKFMNNKATPNWTERILNDFRVIDLSLIENAIDSMHF